MKSALYYPSSVNRRLKHHIRNTLDHVPQLKLLTPWPLWKMHGCWKWDLRTHVADQIHEKLSNNSIWLRAIKQPAITWASVYSDLWRHTVSLGHNESNEWDRNEMVAMVQTPFLNTFVFYENGILTQISHGFVRINSMAALVQIMAHAEQAIRHHHYDDVRMGAIASQITSLTIVYSIVYSDADQRKHQSSASLAFVWVIHRGPVNFPHKWPVTRKMFTLDDVIMLNHFFQFMISLLSPNIQVIWYTTQVHNSPTYLYTLQWLAHIMGAKGAENPIGFIGSLSDTLNLIYLNKGAGVQQWYLSISRQ